MARHRIHPEGAVALGLVASLLLAGCGAGSRTGAEAATKVSCDFEKPAQPVDVNVLAYNSSAIDPFTNTMVASCSRNGATLEHEPIDFDGQVQKTTATLAGGSGTYDILETYGFVIPQFAAEDELVPLDALFEKYSDKYDLTALNEQMLNGMSYDGKLYGLPMQAQMFVLAYRKDVFDKVGLQPPETFEELRQVSKKIQDSGEMDYPLALPLLASADLATAYDAALGSLGVDYTDPESMQANFDTPEAAQAFEELKSLTPYMDPEVTTFDQPAVQQQLYNGDAAMGIMFSGRMIDLVDEEISQYSDKFAFAAAPSVEEGGPSYNALSIDGWSIPANTGLDRDMLFEMMASSVNEKASKASIPAAYPARTDMVTEQNSPYAAAANESIDTAPPTEPYPWTAQISNDTLPVVANVMVGELTVEEGTRQMQDIATRILSSYE